MTDGSFTASAAEEVKKQGPGETPLQIRIGSRSVTGDTANLQCLPLGEAKPRICTAQRLAARRKQIQRTRWTNVLFFLFSAVAGSTNAGNVNNILPLVGGSTVRPEVKTKTKTRTILSGDGGDEKMSGEKISGGGGAESPTGSVLGDRCQGTVLPCEESAGAAPALDDADHHGKINNNDGSTDIVVHDCNVNIISPSSTMSGTVDTAGAQEEKTSSPDAPEENPEARIAHATGGTLPPPDTGSSLSSTSSFIPRLICCRSTVEVIEVRRGRQRRRHLHRHNHVTCFLVALFMLLLLGFYVLTSWHSWDHLINGYDVPSHAPTPLPTLVQHLDSDENVFSNAGRSGKATSFAAGVLDVFRTVSPSEVEGVVLASGVNNIQGAWVSLVEAVLRSNVGLTFIILAGGNALAVELR